MDLHQSRCASVPPPGTVNWHSGARQCAGVGSPSGRVPPTRHTTDALGFTGGGTAEGLVG